MNEFHHRAKRVLLELLLLDFLIFLLWLIWIGARYYTSGLLLGSVVSLYQVFSIAVQTEKALGFALGKMRRKPVFGMVSRWVAVMLAGMLAVKIPGISILLTVVGLCTGWLVLVVDVLLVRTTDSE